MFSRHPTITALLICLSISASGAAQHSKAGHSKSKPAAAQPQPAAAPQQQTPAPPRPTPEHGPSSPPEVTLRGGQLTIFARNSTLGDVLNAVRTKTGASVDMPPASNERVVGQFGPGAPRDVMAQLLNGSHYDYVLLGSPADPGALKKVVLMARANGPEQVPLQSSQQSLQQNPNLQAVPEVENDQAVEENNAEVQPEVQQPEEEPQPDQQGQEGQQNGPVVKTPEQLLRELQQQQQQQQNAPPPGAPGQPPQ